MNISKKITSVLLIALSIILYSCNTTEPENDNINPGSRNYEWDIDTINVQGYMTKIWGSSSNDVWCVGDANMNENIWHYNGLNWSSDGIKRYENPWSIFGFNNASVWLAGSEKKFWFYNGITWNITDEIKLSGFSDFLIMDIWGNQINNVYAVGYGIKDDKRQSGVIFRFDGTNWQPVNTDIEPIALTYIREAENAVLVGARQNNSAIGDTSKLFLLKNKNLELITSSLRSINITLIGEDAYVTIGSTIYKYYNSKLKPWKEISEDQFGYRIWGRNEKDIFLRMKDGIAHFNGNNIEYLYKFNTTNTLSINGAAIFSDTVYFLITDYTTQMNLILKGSLN